MFKTIILGTAASASIAIAGYFALVAPGSVAAQESAALPRAATIEVGRCDQANIAAVFAADANVRVALVKAFKQGDDLTLGGAPRAPAAQGTQATPKAAKDLCMVKLMVGPGNPGPTDAPSTSAGIGIEIWLPSVANWNGRLHVLGGGGYQGTAAVSSTSELNARGGGSSAGIAVQEGAVSASTDAGYVSQDGSGSFLMLPDGSINRTLWNDFAGRSLHEMAVRTRQLAIAYFGKAPIHAYFDGCSTGGRQGHKEAQAYPGDYDGILAGAPAINWTSFITSELYPQIVIQRELDGMSIPTPVLSLVSAAAVSACDADLNGAHAGYISDPGICRYDPLKDPTVLCKADGGQNDKAVCIGRKQAAAVNRIWYGQTSDGSYADPAIANGFSASLRSKQLWFGLNRGTRLQLASSPFGIATSTVALNLQDSRLAPPGFRNAKANGEDGWKRLTYAELARSTQQGIALQKAFGDINTDTSDLSRFRDKGGKILVYHGMADQLITIQGTEHYVDALSKHMGGQKKLSSFYRLYPVPAMGHCGGVGSIDGISGVSPKAEPPLPKPGQLYDQLVAWVEKGIEPSDIVLSNASGTNNRPLCQYPTKLQYKGGDRNSASSYTCK